MQQNGNTSDDTTSPQASQILPGTMAAAMDPIQLPLGNPFINHLSSSLSQPPSYQGLLDWGQLDYGIASECLGSLQVMQYPMVSSVPLTLHADLQRMTDQETSDAKALAASRNHSEAERRRRERINNHLAKLRSLLPTTTKTDKASLLAEVIHHVKDLKRQTSQIPAETSGSSFPTETDELTVDNYASDQDGRMIIKASICCDDRSDLLPDLIRALKSLKLKALRAEIATVGGRVKNVLFITAEEEEQQYNSSENDVDEYFGGEWWIRSIQEALKAVMEKSVGGVASSGSGSVKRQRTHTSIFSLQGPLLN